MKKDIMSTKNLSNQEAYDKLKELAESIDYAMFETNLGARPTHVIPMSTKKCDQEGSLWFLSNKDSDHNSFIHKDKDVPTTLLKAYSDGVYEHLRSSLYLQRSGDHKEAVYN